MINRSERAELIDLAFTLQKIQVRVAGFSDESSDHIEKAWQALDRFIGRTPIDHSVEPR